jgi:hypothetical protein
MGFLDIFNKDRALEWPECVETDLLFDVETRSLGGVGLGESFEMLRMIGRPDNESPVQSGLFKYYRLGFLAGVIKGKIDHFSFIMIDEDGEGFESAVVGVRIAEGSEAEITEKTTPGDVKKIFGEPGGSTQYEDFYDLVYEMKDLSLVFEFTGEGRLIGFDAYAEKPV